MLTIPPLDDLRCSDDEYRRPRSAIWAGLVAGDGPDARGSPGARPKRKTLGNVKNDWPSTKKSYCRNPGVGDSGGDACATIFNTWLPRIVQEKSKIAARLFE